MKIAIIGTGYVGLPSGVGFAELGNEVICIDKIKEKIDQLNNGKSTIYEKDLEKLLIKNIKNKKIKFSTQISDILGCDIIILTVGTPPHPKTKEADMSYIYQATEELAPFLNDYSVVAIKSTCPIGCDKEIKDIITKTNPKADFDIVLLPEFLREGFAIYDFFNPDRIIVGSDSTKATNIIKELYKPFQCPILYMSNIAAGMVKYASNAMLAIKIHYINEIANLCEKVGADIMDVARGIGLDSRIGDKFLNPGPGYGGFCFPKDTLAIALIAKKNNISLNLIETAIKENENRQKQIANKIIKACKNIKNPSIAVLGLAFKAGTDDCRLSPAINIIQELLKNNFKIKAHDPKAIKSAKEFLGDKIDYINDMDEIYENADILVILTEWQEFKKLDLNKVAKKMKNKIIIDCRNLLDKNEAIRLGFIYKGIGR